MTSYSIDKVKPELTSFMKVSGIPFKEFVDPHRNRYIYSIYDTVDLTELLKLFPKNLCRADITWAKYSIDYYYKPSEQTYYSICIRTMVAESKEKLAEKEAELFSGSVLTWGHPLFDNSRAKFVDPMCKFASDRDTQIATQLLAAASWISNDILIPDAPTRVRRIMSYYLVFRMWNSPSADGTWMKEIFPNKGFGGELIFDLPNTNVDSQDPFKDYFSGIVNGDGITRVMYTLKVNLPKKCVMEKTLVFDLDFEDETTYMDIYPMKAFIGNILDTCDYVKSLSK